MPLLNRPRLWPVSERPEGLAAPYPSGPLLAFQYSLTSFTTRPLYSTIIECEITLMPGSGGPECGVFAGTGFPHARRNQSEESTWAGERTATLDPGSPSPVSRRVCAHGQRCARRTWKGLSMSFRSVRPSLRCRTKSLNGLNRRSPSASGWRKTSSVTSCWPDTVATSFCSCAAMMGAYSRLMKLLSGPTATTGTNFRRCISTICGGRKATRLPTPRWTRPIGQAFSLRRNIVEKTAQRFPLRSAPGERRSAASACS